MHFHSAAPGGAPGAPGAPAAPEDEWSSSALQLELGQLGQLGPKAPRSLRCEASIYGVWLQSSDEVPLRGDHPQLAPVRGASSACGE